MQQSNSYEIKSEKQHTRVLSSRGTQKFTLLEKVGSGTYGVVYKAVDNKTSEVKPIIEFNFYVDCSNQENKAGQRR